MHFAAHCVQIGDAMFINERHLKERMTTPMFHRFREFMRGTPVTEFPNGEIAIAAHDVVQFYKRARVIVE